VGDHRSNLVVFPGGTGPVRAWPVHSEFLRVVVTQLDELTRALEQLYPQLSWSPRRWRIATTKCRMRISIMREMLRELVGGSPASEQSAIRWALELDGVRLELERWSDEVTARFQALQCPGLPFTDRSREFEMLLVGRRELLRVLVSARDLILQRVSLTRRRR
jgi:hypothetical protein